MNMKIIVKIGNFQVIQKNSNFHLFPPTFGEMSFPNSQVFSISGTKPGEKFPCKYGFKLIKNISLLFLFK